MNFWMDKSEADEKIRNLSEAQRIEFRRRIDACYAVIASLEPLVLKRGELDETMKSIKDPTKSSVLYGAFWGAIAVYWLADWVDLSWLKVIAAVVGAASLATYLGDYERQYVARARLREIEQLIAQLRFQWLATGAQPYTFDEYGSLIVKLGTRPEWEDSQELDAAMRSEVLRRVADQRVHVHG